jgi:hypothetical protein
MIAIMLPAALFYAAASVVAKTRVVLSQAAPLRLVAGTPTEPQCGLLPTKLAAMVQRE